MLGVEPIALSSQPGQKRPVPENVAPTARLTFSARGERFHKDPVGPRKLRVELERVCPRAPLLRRECGDLLGRECAGFA
jgi:hypothetical protein